jgi:hypothetical protein
MIDDNIYRMKNERMMDTDLRKILKTTMIICMVVGREKSADIFHKLTIDLAAIRNRFINDRALIRALMIPVDDEIKQEFGASMYEMLYSKDPNGKITKRKT